MRSGDVWDDRPAGGILDDAGPVAAASGVVDAVDLLRADHYDLLAVLFGRSPSPDLLAGLASLEGDATPLGRAVTALARAAADADVVAVQREYFDLFVGVGRGELVPFASYYLTGFLNERPLARLREDLRRLGIEATGGMSEPEDHVAIVMEIMAGLASGRFGTAPGTDRAFFASHVEPWAGRLFRDVERADASRFYRAAGAFGALYMDIEAQAFDVDAARAS